MKPARDPRRRTRRVLIEKRTSPQAGNGEPVDTWEPMWKTAEPESAPIYLWAEKLEGRALEKFAAAQRIAETAAVFNFAWAPANQIDPALHRLKYEGRTYEITGSVEEGQRQGVNVMCSAVASTPGGVDGPQ